MNIYNYQEAFGAADITSDAMKKAMESWYALYYAQEGTKQENPCQRIAYTVVAKLVKTIFGEYQTRCEGTLLPKAVQALNRAMTEDPIKARDYANLLMYQAQLMADLPIEDPVAYTDLVRKLMK